MLLDWLQTVSPAIVQWENEHALVFRLLALASLLLVAWIGNFIARRLLLRALTSLAARSSTTWDDALIEHHVFDHLSHLVPAMVLYFGVGLIDIHMSLSTAISRLAATAMVLIGIRTISGLLNALNDIYLTFPEAKNRPIKGYLQVIAIAVYILGGIVAIAVLFDKSPLGFLTGVGAMSAVLILVFKDTLLSLVASVQLTSNDMVRVGDWIEVPDHGADGEVVDIALHTVKVSNWDKTTTTIPTYALISHGFKNWRTMPESGGRRIRRSLFVDQQTVRYLTDSEIAELSRYELLADYLARKKAEIESYNQTKAEVQDKIPSLRRLTNIGTLRAYIAAYLASRDDINQQMTLLVRQLGTTPHGLPIEIYCFTRTTEWLAYETIQSDIFDHLLAVIGEFDLHVFQNPSGATFLELAEQMSSASSGE